MNNNTLQEIAELNNYHQIKKELQKHGYEFCDRDIYNNTWTFSKKGERNIEVSKHKFYSEKFFKVIENNW